MHVVVRPAVFGAGCVTILLALAMPAVASASPGAPKVTAVAGTGAAGGRGDGGPARGAELDAPTGIAVDSAGDIAVADSGNCRIRMMAARAGRHFGRAMRPGRIYTVAGMGCGRHPASGSSEVALVDPTAVAFDARGDLLIADASGNRVLELPAVSGRNFAVAVTAGRLVSLAGTGAAGSSADGRPARSALLDEPRGVAVDAEGDLFIADTGNCRVQEVPNGPASSSAGGGGRRAGHLYTVAGTGVCGDAGDAGPAAKAELWAPTAVAVDGAGDLLIADQGNCDVREVPVTTGTFYDVPIAAGNIGTVAGQGAHSDYLNDGLSAAGPAADLNFPTGLAVDGAGDLFIADSDERSIREVAAHDATVFGRRVIGGDMYTLAGMLPVGGAGPAGDGTKWISTRLVYPYGVAAGPGGSIYFSDQGANRVRRIAGP
ncbi:MAG TPA: hypothetical protein VNC61_10390 [Acidimicrobiales bacterium]|nr:hypothetical protein [Acidimicrobiales bacterium]